MEDNDANGLTDCDPICVANEPKRVLAVVVQVKQKTVELRPMKMVMVSKILTVTVLMMMLVRTPVFFGARLWRLWWRW